MLQRDERDDDDVEGHRMLQARPRATMTTKVTASPTRPRTIADLEGHNFFSPT